jgi:tetratricopeptide (TPR) repeat protein
MRKKSHFIWILFLSLLFGWGLVSNPASAQEKSKQIYSGVDELSAYESLQHFIRGDWYEIAGDLPSAVEEYKKALELNPSVYEIRLALAHAYFRQNRMEDALAEAQKIEPQTSQLFSFLGDCYRNLKENEKAAEAYKTAIELDSTNADAYWNLAFLYQILGKSEQTITELKKLSQIYPFNPGIRMQLGGILFSSNRWDEAIEEYKKVTQLNPEEKKAWLALGTIYEIKKDFENATYAYGKALKLDFYNAEIRNRISLVSSFLEQFSKAESVFVSLRTSFPSDPFPYVSLGRIAMQKGEYPSAKEYFNQAILLADTAIQGWVGLGLAYQAIDSTEKAIEIYKEGLEKVKNRVELYNLLGLSYVRRASYDSAIQTFQKADSIAPDSPTILFNWGSALERGGYFEQSIKTFEKILKLDPENVLTLNYLGYMLADSGIRLEESYEMIKKALEKEPENPAYLDSYGWVLFRLGRIDEAEIQIKKALEKLDKDSVIYEHLGDIQEAKGNRQEAKEYWKKALELDPKNKRLKEKLQK